MSENWKQVIIARKDLDMSPGKLAAQVSHASMAFLTNQIKRDIRKIPQYPYEISPVTAHPENYRHPDLREWAMEAYNKGKEHFCYAHDDDGLRKISEEEVEYYYKCNTYFDEGIYENWINGSFTKVICEAKNKNKLIKAVEIAADLGLKENEDYFIIRDNCLTELEPEEVDENGVGRTITCIGFVPLPPETANLISKKFQLYK